MIEQKEEENFSVECEPYCEENECMLSKINQDDSVCPPAIMLNDNNAEWDSILEDDTQSNVIYHLINVFCRLTWLR